MNQVLLDYVAQDNLKARPQIRVGMRVKVFQRIKEGNKERTQTFEGLVIKVNKNKGINQTFTVRTIVGGVGVEKIFPVHADTIEKIEVLKQHKVRRAKLYYMRERSGKSARLKENRAMTPEMLNQLVEPVKNELVKEAPKAEEAPAAEVKAEETKAE